MGKMLLPVVMAVLGWTAAMGAALGEEGILYMRGESPEGTPQINRFQFAPGDGGGADARAGRMEQSVPPDGYLGWRENCVRAPLLVGGWKVDMDAPGGFALAPPLVRPDGDFSLLPADAWNDALDAPLERPAGTDAGGNDTLQP